MPKIRLADGPYDGRALNAPCNIKRGALVLMIDGGCVEPYRMSILQLFHVPGSYNWDADSVAHQFHVVRLDPEVPS
jgi:hypothetical protein